MNATPVRAGPSSVPSAASSFTSPAPVAPMKCPGSISSRPTAKPATASAGVRRVTWIAASARPITATLSVTTFGTRRDRRSTATAVPPPAAVITIPAGSHAVFTAVSKVLDNGLPQHGVDGRAHRGNGRHHHDRDQRREKSVLDQVLAIVPACEPEDGRHHAFHW